MKKIILTIIAFIALQTVGYTQIPNLGKVKDKVTTKAKNKADNTVDKAVDNALDSKTSSNSSSSSGNTSSSEKAASDAPKYDPESPKYRAYSIVRDEISSVKYQLKDDEWNRNQEGRNADAIKYWTRAKENLEKLRAEPNEADKSYFKNFEQELANLEAQRKEKFDNYTLDKQYDNKLESFSNFATMGWEIRDTTLEPSYKGYYSFKKDFETTRPEKYKDSYIQSRIEKIDNYFQVEVYKIIPNLSTKVDNIIKAIYEKNSRNEASYMLNAKNYLKDFDKPMETITYNKKYLMEKTEEIDAIQAKIDKEKAMLEEYINSGKYDAHVAKYRQEIIDAVKLGKSAMTNAAYENLAKAGVDEGKANRVVITDAVWSVKTNDYGIPLYKYLPVDIAVTDSNGKCWLAYGQIRKKYEGGGTYGGEYFSYWGKQDEMNCANINK